MQTIPENIAGLGFDQWFLNHCDSGQSPSWSTARVTAAHGQIYLISRGGGEVRAEPLGKLIYQAESPMDYPTVGDWVLAQFYDDDALAVIHSILPRKTVLRRKTSGKKIDFQLIAANIDTAFIVQSLDANYNLRRLERYLVMIHDSGIRPIILLSKSDLLCPAEIDDRITQIGALAPGISVLTFSSISGAGLDPVRDCLEAGRTYCLLGSSGVGKTTLLNRLAGETVGKTIPVRATDGKGRHATTSRQLIRLPAGALLIDTPGMRELGNFDMESGIDATFAEIADLALHCRFNDCTHTSETGCAVLAALEEGTLSEGRYRNYLRISKESVHNAMSYYEKRRRDKNFGKMCKSIMKDKQLKNFGG